MWAGKLNEVIDVYNFKAGRNQYGEDVDYSPLSYSYAVPYNPNDTTSYCTYYTTRAAVIYNGGSRQVKNDEIQIPYSKTFVTRIYVPVTDTSWIKWGDKYYRVTSIEKSREYQEQTISTEIVNE